MNIVERFPDEAASVYRKERTEKMDADIQTASKFSREKVDSIKNSLHISKPPPENLCYIISCSIGFVCTFVVCISVANEYGYLASFISFMVTPMVFCVIGALMDDFLRIQYQTLEEDKKQSSERDIAAENARCEATIQRIRDSAEADCARYSENYQRLFDKQVQYQSLKLSKSASVKSIADWMTAGFARMIDSADRRIYVEQIVVPYSFKVYAHKIECPAGTFDFMKERKKNLNGPVEQAALSIAVASAVQTNIVMRYPHDKSGTNIVVNVSPYSSEYGAAMVRMTYSAPNGNFVRLEDW